MEYLRTLLDYMATCFYGAELLNDVRTFVYEIFFLVLFSFDSFKYKVPYKWGRTSLYEIKMTMDFTENT